MVGRYKGWLDRSHGRSTRSTKRPGDSRGQHGQVERWDKSLATCGANIKRTTLCKFGRPGKPTKAAERRRCKRGGSAAERRFATSVGMGVGHGRVSEVSASSLTCSPRLV